MSNIFDVFKKIENKRDENTASPVSFLIVGLGNPGREYENTRHNAGFGAIDYIASRAGATINRVKFNALTSETVIAGKKVLLMKPQTLMNLSGNAVAPAAKFYRIPLSSVIVISDDINLDPGRMRFRTKGSDGGQKGLRSIISCIGSEDFPRIRIGVGKKPHPDYDLASWVLGVPCQADRELIQKLYPALFSGVEKIISGDIEGAMQLCNSFRS